MEFSFAHILAPDCPSVTVAVDTKTGLIVLTHVPAIIGTNKIKIVPSDLSKFNHF